MAGPDLPILPTMGVGSYAAPGWFVAAWRAARKDERGGEWGEHDVEELFADGTRIVVADQIEAGVDILSDGELRRQRFVYEMFDRLDGLERVPPRRRLGVPGYDRAPHFAARDRIAAPGGLGAVEEFEALRRFAPADMHEARALKIAIPGPLTFGGFVDAGARDGVDLLNDLIGIVNAELKSLVAAGATYVQLDEPGLPAAPHGLSMAEAADVINRAFDGVRARRALHVCFGNNAGRPMADRRMDRLMPAIEALKCDQLVLEFANREFAGVELLAPLAERFDVAAGVIDVKNFRVETAEDVADRIARCLVHVPAERLTVTADCGFSALPRYLARAKLDAMVAGARIARGRL
jgi:5-methyltetrahydropteroyltriglutamate--homocysteine methyltransferase